MSADDALIPADVATARSTRCWWLATCSVAGRILYLAILGLAVLWGTFAIYYSNLPAALRPVIAVVFAAAPFALRFLVKPRWKRRLVFWGLFAAVFVWWKLIPPSNNRDWQPDLAVLPWAQVDGSSITVHNIRLCDYRGEKEFDVHHYDRTFDLDTLHAADFYLVTWGSPHIAHSMMSFGFANDQYLCFSIETRKEKGEDYSTVKGFFKQYELMYVAADERDVVRLRTNFRHEQVSIYRLKSDPAIIRGVFMGYINAMNSLHDHAEWYNALTSNCLTNIRGHTLPYAANKQWDWRFLLNGHLDELIYERGSVDTSLPFPEMKARSLINANAEAAGNDNTFSKRIREGVPGMAHPR
jgi:hypothetical protein